MFGVLQHGNAGTLELLQARSDPEYSVATKRPPPYPATPTSWGHLRIPPDEGPGTTLLDYLEAGESIDDFLEGFPSVKREQVIAVLDRVERDIVANA